MPKLIRTPDGGWLSRKRIPQDVRAEYKRLYGQGHEVKLRIPPGGTEGAAQRAYGDWLSEYQQRVAAIRAAQRGEGIELTPRNARALAGQWYHWFVERHPVANERYWVAIRDRVHDAITSYVASEDEAEDPDALYREDPRVRKALRPLLSDIGETAQFLALKRLTLTHEAHALFVDNLYDDLAAALQRFMRITRGDYSPDKYPDRFPAFEGPDSGETPARLFERWIDAKRPAAATIESWRYVFSAMGEHFAGRSAASISPDEANAWIKGLISPERSAATVKKTWLNASNAIFRWAMEHKHINRNPFAQIKITVPKQSRHRETKAFRGDEQQLILGAALAIDDTNGRVDDAAKRWVPWLCAYSGARPGEITQLRGSDVVKQDGIDAIRITPEAGTVKGGQTRVVPIHEHLLAQGFLKFVSRRGQGPLFYAPRHERGSSRGATGSKAPYSQVRQRLAEWVRSIGVTDEHVSPNHAWRHTFKQIADREGISERMSDYITGHAHKSEGARYGAPTLSDMAQALKKFP
jgi:integrase